MPILSANLSCSNLDFFPPASQDACQSTTRNMCIFRQLGNPETKLVGGFNPSEKYARQNGFIFPKFRGENKKYWKPPPSKPSNLPRWHPRESIQGIMHCCTHRWTPQGPPLSAAVGSLSEAWISSQRKDVLSWWMTWNTVQYVWLSRIGYIFHVRS